MIVDLTQFDNSCYSPGRSRLVIAIWYFVNVLFLKNPLNPSSKFKVVLLRLFGAKVGVGVNLKPSINIKYPWNLEIGDYSWIGENVWIDSLDKVRIGNNVCLSQGTYLCTGNHDWSDCAFGLVVKPVEVEDGAWVGAGAIVLPGVTIATHSVITAGAVVSQGTEPYMIYSGNPAVFIRKRVMCGE